MAEVPRIVRERLSHQVAGEHPDANLLSAFAERALTEPEREQVLNHLSRCSECRQIVALAAPELTEERLAAVVPVRTLAGASRSWWRSPLLHWGAFTAAALVVLIAVGARMRLREGRSASAPAIATSSVNEVAQKSSMPASEVSPAPAEQKPSGKKVAKQLGPPSPAPAVTTGKPGGVAGGIVGGGVAKTSPALGAYSAGAAATETVGGNVRKDEAAFGTATGAGARTAPPPPPPAPVAPQMKMQAKADERDSFGFDNDIEKSRQKEIAAPSAANEAVKVNGAAAPALKSEGALSSKSESAAMLAKRASLTARWAFSNSGVLQRSFDGGRSWKNVAVGDGVTFRAVATVGSDVWAGGSDGALFHSADGGEHWSRVPMVAKDRPPSGDIIRIEFTSAQDGVVTTSTGETWATSDSGVTWHPQ